MSKPKKKNKKDRLADQRRRRQKQRNQQAPSGDTDAACYSDDEGLHFLIRGHVPPDQATLDEMTRRYQQNVRNSPLWEEMVREFGTQRAEELLKEFRAELR